MQLTGDRFAVRQSSSNLAEGVDTGGHAAQRRARPVQDAPPPPPFPAAPPTPAFLLSDADRIPDVTEPTMVNPSSPRIAGARAPPPIRYQTEPVAVSLPKEVLAPVAPASQLEIIWRAYGKRLVTLVAAVLVLGWAVRRVGRMIERASQETSRASAELHAGIHGQNPVLAGAGNSSERDALARRLEQGQRDAARGLEAASALFRRGNFVEAISVCDSVVDRYPKLPEATEAAFLRARALLAAGRDRDAIDALARFTSEHRGSAHYGEALLRAGEAYLKISDHVSALAPLDDLVRSMPDSPFATEGYLRRGQALALKGDIVSAEADYRIVIGRTGPADALHVQAQEALKMLPPAPPAR
jgi:TolA-binding protein